MEQFTTRAGGRKGARYAAEFSLAAGATTDLPVQTNFEELGLQIFDDAAAEVTVYATMKHELIADYETLDISYYEECTPGLEISPLVSALRFVSASAAAKVISVVGRS